MSDDVKRAWVERVLGVDLGGGTADAAGGTVVRLAKAMLTWNAARRHVADEIDKLQQAILDQCSEEEDFPEVEANIDILDEILERLDDRLTEVLNQMRGATEDGAKQDLAAQARKIVQEYQAYIDQDELVNDLADNGFVAVDVKPAVQTALAAVLEQI